jgi:hypothetical protein
MSSAKATDADSQLAILVEASHVFSRESNLHYARIGGCNVLLAGLRVFNLPIQIPSKLRAARVRLKGGSAAQVVSRWLRSDHHC